MTHTNDQDLILQDALLIYSNHQHAVICRAAAEVVDEQVVFSNPVRVTDDVVSAMLEKTRQRLPLHLPVLGAHILAVAPDSVAWFIPARKRTLIFMPHTNGTGIKAAQGKNIPQPPLVMAATPRGLSVWALAEDVRPGPQTPLFKAPYWNVFSSHLTCLGSMHRPARNAPDTTQEWEDSFYESNFTHSCEASRWPSRWTYLEFLQAAIKAGTFNPDWLTPSGMTLESALSKVAGGQS